MTDQKVREAKPVKGGTSTSLIDADVHDVSGFHVSYARRWPSPSPIEYTTVV